MLASALNEPAAGATTSNQVTVPLGADGKVSIFTQSGAHLVADVAGYYVTAGGFHSLMPTRILDTRGGDQQLAYSGPKPAGGQTITLPVGCPRVLSWPVHLFAYSTPVRAMARWGTRAIVPVPAR